MTLQDISNIVNEVNITLNRYGASDTCVVKTSPINNIPQSTNLIRQLVVKDSTNDVLFSGKFAFPIKQPLKPDEKNIFTLKAESEEDITKKTIMENDYFTDKSTSDILIQLLQKYLPNINRSGIEYCENKITVDFNGYNLFDAIQILCDASMYYFKIGFGRNEDGLVAYFKPLDDFFDQAGVSIDDENFTSAEPFYYDINTVYNKIRVIGKPVKQERLISYKIGTGENEYSFQEFTLTEQYEPYNISIEYRGTVLQGTSTGEYVITFGENDYIYHQPTKTIIFRDKLEDSGWLIIHYSVDVPPMVTREDYASINTYGLRQGEDVIIDWSDDYSFLSYIADKFIEYNKDPKLFGSITMERSQLPFAIYPNDKINVNLSRYYQGSFIVGQVTHTINNVRHWITIYPDTTNIWDAFAKMLRRMRELDRNKKKPISEVMIKEDTENTICWRTEFIAVDLYIPGEEDPEWRELELQTIYIERPFVDFAIRIKPDLDEEIPYAEVRNDVELLSAFISIYSPDTNLPEMMTRSDFKELTNTNWNLNWDDEIEVYHKLWYFNDFPFLLTEKDGQMIEEVLDYPEAYQVIFRITGYGALKLGKGG